MAQAHEGGAAALSLAIDIGGTGVLTGGDDGRLVRTSADGTMRTLFETSGRQIEAIAVSDVAGLRGRCR
jgi:hypothetical protein